MKLLYGILLMPMTILCQSFIKIQCNETLQLPIGSSHYQFNFSENGKKKSFNELELASYRFTLPGIYEIDVLGKRDKEEDCLHVQLPSKIDLIVDSIQIHFIENSIRTSEPIRMNHNTEGISLFVDVEVSNFFGDRVQMNSNKVTAAGIGSSITASLDSKFFKLNEGKHTLNYHLKGVCSEASYIQFDFLAPNGTIFPLALKTPVQK
jgi:hypothetical protein